MFELLPPDPVIVFENDDALVAYKPSGMHTCGSGISGDPTLLDWIVSLRPGIGALEGRGGREGGLLHRLDRDASGLVAFAKNDRAFAFLATAAGEGLFSKSYDFRACPSGAGLRGSAPQLASPGGIDAAAWAAASTGIDGSTLASLAALAVSGGGCLVSSVFRAYGPRGAKVACAAPEGIPAKGGWGTVEYSTRILSASFDRNEKVLAGSARLARGFRHQVRAHLTWVGLPLDGDLVYGGRRADRLMLHARALEFPDPTGSGTVSVRFPE